MKIRTECVAFRYRTPFAISDRTWTHARALHVEIESDGVIGRAEALGVYYRGEAVEAMETAVLAASESLGEGVSRKYLLQTMPPGGARNAIDCALWDLEAKRSGVRVWTLAGLNAPGPAPTTLTIGVGDPAAMAAAARAARDYPILKIKLAGDGDLDRVEAIRAARPEARLVVDANQGWSEQHLETFVPRLAELGVELIEQPLPAGADDALLRFDSPIPICADESCQDRASLDALEGKYAFINIKLDKTGGLTEALELARAAAPRFGLMVGCMGGSSLSMAPASLLVQFCAYADLDGPLLLADDVSDALTYRGGAVFPPSAALWG